LVKRFNFCFNFCLRLTGICRSGRWHTPKH